MASINNSFIFDYCISNETTLFNQYFSANFTFSHLLSCKPDFRNFFRNFEIYRNIPNF